MELNAVDDDISMDTRSSDTANQDEICRKQIVDCIRKKDWEGTIKIFNEIQQIQEQDSSTSSYSGEKIPISKEDFFILWNDAPTNVLGSLLKIQPDAHKQESRFRGGRGGRTNLIQTKMKRREWEFLSTFLFHEFPYTLKDTTVIEAIRYKAP